MYNYSIEESVSVYLMLELNRKENAFRNINKQYDHLPGVVGAVQLVGSSVQ